MKFSDLFMSFFVFFMFFLINLYLYVMIYINDIKDNWPMYRCNPTVMPFAGFFGKDPAQNFAQCIQNMQSGFMTEFLEPVYYIINLTGGASKEIMKSMEDIKRFVDSMQSSVGMEFGDMGGIMRKLQIAMQGILIGMLDTFSRLGGILMLFVRFLDGSIMTLKTGFEACFHPDTPVTMADGTTKKMKDVNLGDKLANDTHVISTMKILPQEQDKYYAIYSKELKETIYVTGSHFILDENKNKFIPVEKFKHAQESITKPEVMYCLITNTHNIPVGEYTFYDWEDDDISKKYYLTELFH